jgi:hypothetical protein
MDDTVSFGYVKSERIGLPGASPISTGDDFVAALKSGGDSRLAVDRYTGVNRYWCPATPAPGLICASSCTATPIAARGFQRAAEFYDCLISTASAPERAKVLERRRRDLMARLLRYFNAEGIAQAILCPSGTDALLTATLLLARERPAEPITAIIPQASETGAGVPLAVAGRWFDGVAPCNMPPLPDLIANTVEIALRSAEGVPLSDDEVVEAYAYAAAGARGHPVVYLTHSTKTGLIAPRVPPPGIDVVVDASQSRIEPLDVARFLRRGWPVVVTGSKFFGGPPFAGAVLFPTARLSAAHRNVPPTSQHDVGHPSRLNAGPANLGMILRWIAAMDVIEDFLPLAAGMTALLQKRAAAIDRCLGVNTAFVKVGGLEECGSLWSDLPSIFTFALRDPADRRRLLPAVALRPLYERLARHGILLGQPVDLGQFGGLRIAVGARDLLPAAPADGGLDDIFSAVQEVYKTTRNCSGSMSKQM